MDATADCNSNEKVYVIDGMFPRIDKLELFPTEILWSLFNSLNDADLYSMAIICDRFGCIAQTVFEQRYAHKYFVIKKNQGKFQQRIEFIGKFIGSFELRDFRHLDQNHWIIRLLKRLPTKRLYFTNCDFEHVEKALHRFKHITHLALDGGCGFGFARFPNFCQLEEFKLCYFDGMYYSECEKIIKNNHHLESIDITADAFSDPWHIIECVTKNSKNLIKLRLINEALPVNTQSINAIEEFVNTSKSIVSLGISTDNRSVQLLQRLGHNCKCLKHLDLFHVDHTLSNEMIQAIGSFDTINSLALVFKSYEDGLLTIVGNLPNLIHLSVTYRVQTPSNNNYILQLMKKCATLETIVMDTHIDRFKPKQPIVEIGFRNEFKQISLNRPKRVTLEIKEQGKTIACL